MPWSRPASRSPPGCRTSGWRRSRRGSSAGGIPLRTLPARRSASATRPATGRRAACRWCCSSARASATRSTRIGSLVIPYGFGFPAVISMRGTLGERNPSQMPLGRTTAGMLDLLGVQAFPLSRGRTTRGLARARIAVAEGARVLAPIMLEAELELAMNPTEIVRAILDGRTGCAVRLVARHGDVGAARGERRRAAPLHGRLDGHRARGGARRRREAADA